MSEHVYFVAITFKMTEQVEQKLCIKFYVRFEHSSVETIQIIQKTFGDDAVSAVQMLQRWPRIC